jgi:hypothetical protein
MRTTPDLGWTVTLLFCFACIHRPFDLYNVSGIDEFPEPIFYCGWVAINRFNEFSRFHFAIGKRIEDLLTEWHT